MPARPSRARSGQSRRLAIARILSIALRTARAAMSQPALPAIAPATANAFIGADEEYGGCRPPLFRRGVNVLCRADALEHELPQ